MSQLSLDITAPAGQSPATIPVAAPAVARAVEQAPTVSPAAPPAGEWATTPPPHPTAGDVIEDRYGRVATVLAVRDVPGINESIDAELHQDAEGGRLIGLFLPDWWRDWRQA